MQNTFTLLMPFLAALVGTGFLIMIIREATTRAHKRGLGQSALDRISDRLDIDLWPEPETAPRQAMPEVLHTVDSTLTLSFVVVCAEALAYSVYLYFRENNELAFHALRPDVSNMVCLLGLVLVGAAGFVRFREWKQ